MSQTGFTFSLLLFFFSSLFLVQGPFLVTSPSSAVPPSQPYHTDEPVSFRGEIILCWVKDTLEDLGNLNYVSKWIFNCRISVAMRGYLTCVAFYDLPPNHRPRKVTSSGYSWTELKFIIRKWQCTYTPNSRTRCAPMHYWRDNSLHVTKNLFKTLVTGHKVQRN